MNQKVLRLEGLAVFAASVYFYSYHQLSWPFFFAFLFAPDVSMAGYLLNNQIGAAIYNAFHTYSVPLAMIALGAWLPNETVLAAGLVWCAHIGLDRMLGYGLKYPTHFKDTHLNRV
jgi:hypothetical protein